MEEEEFDIAADLLLPLSIGLQEETGEQLHSGSVRVSEIHQEQRPPGLQPVEG